MDATRLGKYEIRGTLGRGAMGLVYEGWDPAIARRVAIKTVRLPDTTDSEAAELLARFRREAQAAGRLNHPNIVGVFDYGETDEVAFIVMEFIDGRSLKTVLDGRELLPPAEIARIIASLLAGLQYSHDNGVVHRDIKPANIMLTAGGQVKIADFGIARIESSNMTQTGAVLGTPAYMSPEQFMGQPVDRRTDIYSCGVVLYQMLTGERPFDGGMSSIMHKALNTTPPRPSDLSVVAPPAFDAVVAKAMAKRPENRFATAAAFAQALHDAMAAAAAGGDDDATRVATRAPTPAAPVRVAPARAATVEPETAKSGKRSVPVIAALVVLLFALFGASVWYMLPRRAAEQSVAELNPPPPAASVQAPAVPPAAVPAPASPAEVSVAKQLPPAVPPTEDRPAAVAQPAAEPPPPASPAAEAVAPPLPSPAAAPATPNTTLARATPAPELMPPAPPAQAEMTAVPPPAVGPAAEPIPPQRAVPAPTMQTPSGSSEMASLSPEPTPALPAPTPTPAPLFDFTGARSLARAVPCALLDISEQTTPQGIVPRELFGVALPGTEFDGFLRQLRKQYADVSNAVRPLASGHCAAVAAIGDLVRRSHEQNLALRVIAPAAPVPVDGRFKVGAAIDRDVDLYADLYEADGWVHHLLHGDLRPGSTGEVEDTIAVEAPGLYLLVAIATPTPLGFGQRPPRERADTYLPALKRELARLPSTGAAPVRAEIAVISAVARPAALARRGQPVAAAIPRAPNLNASRCADIVARVQLGEELSDADRTTLRNSCGH